MEIKTESKKVGFFQFVLYVALIALIVVVMYQNRRINVLIRNNIEVLHNNVSSEKAIDNADAQKAHSVGDKDKSYVAMDTPGKKTDDINKMKVSVGKPVDGAESTPPSGQIGNIMGKLASEIQNNPAMESMIRTQLTARLNDTYGSFAEEFNLSPEKKTGLINLLAEKQMETIDMASRIGELQKGNTSPDTLTREREYVDNLYNEKISELLTPEQFEAYREYIKYESERLFLSEFKKNMEYTGGIDLDKQQEKDLVFAMYNERQKLNERQVEIEPSINNQTPGLNSENL